MSALAGRLAATANAVLAVFGLRLVRHEKNPVDFDEEDHKVLEAVIDKKLSMAGPERLFTTLMACRHVCRAGVPGDFVECGVWRGGNSIIAADVFRRHSPQKNVFLFDTFAGMTEPTVDDVDNRNRRHASALYRKSDRESHNEWCYSPLDEVKSHLSAFGISSDRARFIQGDVLDTLSEPENLPESIAVLRLDTDWYESTKKELEVLWPRLQPGGILIVDDYGHWGGAKKAVDEFFEAAPRPFFAYTDYTGRVAVKTTS